MGLPAWLPALPFCLPPPHDQYRLVALIGEPGGQGIVFLAEDSLNVNQPDCAIKFPLFSSAGDFLREASAGQTFNHPNLARTRGLLDFRQCAPGDWPANSPCVAQVMNYYPCSLAGFRDAYPNHRFPAWYVVQWARQLAWAIAELAARGLVHRDIKPANLFFELTAGRRFDGPEALEGATLLLGDFGTLGPLGGSSSNVVYRCPDDPWKSDAHYPTWGQTPPPTGQSCTAAMDLSSLGRVLGVFRDMTDGNSNWLRLVAERCERDPPPPITSLVPMLSEDWDEQARLFREAGHRPQEHLRFIGRDFIHRRFNEFAAGRRDRGGIFVLVAHAGVGKTAFLTHWAESTGQPFGYYFRYRDNRTAAADMPRALAAQLIRGFAPGTQAPTSDTELTGFLERLLATAAQSVECPRPLFLFVDGLDEADDPNRAAQFLPKSLPAGVFLIVSTRPPAQGRDHLALLRNAGACIYELAAGDPDNLCDVAHYLQDALAGQITPEQAVAVADTTGGIFLLATLLVEAIQAGTLTVAEAMALALHWTNLGVAPSQRLTTYYQESWERIAAGQDPVAMAEFAGVMAATCHWVTESQIVQFLNHYARSCSGQANPPWNPFRLRQLLHQLSWFLARRAGEGTSAPSYQIRHQSVHDYLLSPEGPVPDDGLRLMHGAIGTFYDAAAQAQRRGWENVDSYGRFFAVRHLILSGAVQHLQIAARWLCDLGYLQATVGDRDQPNGEEHQP